MFFLKEVTSYERINLCLELCQNIPDFSILEPHNIIYDKNTRRLEKKHKTPVNTLRSRVLSKSF